jgi:hypothetical protein
MDTIVFRYRSRDLTQQDVEDILGTISRHWQRGRSYISRVLCQQWDWVQPNGKLKEYAARDLLLRLEEKGIVDLPPRLRQKNNTRRRSFSQTPIFTDTPVTGHVKDFSGLHLQPLSSGEDYLWGYLLHHHHYLGVPRLVGEHLKYLAWLDGQVVACLAWASAAFKVKSRDDFIGWSAAIRRQRLHLVANNARFLILPWVRIKHLASKVLALNVRRLSADWQTAYHHPIHLAETFVDISRFEGTCYKAANWQCVGKTNGSAKRGNIYQFHGQPKAIYLYPLDRHFRRLLADDQG